MDQLRHFIDLKDISPETLRTLVREASRRKAARQGMPHGKRDQDSPLIDHALALVFEKASTRTRYSFIMGMHQLAGRAFVVDTEKMQLDRGEPIEDTARVLSSYVDAVMYRTTTHDRMMQLADKALIPIINGLTSRSHPCQVIADIQTVNERIGDIKGKKVLWAGATQCNVCTSWIEAAVAFDFELVCACPPEFTPNEEAQKFAQSKGAKITVTDDIRSAVKDCNVIITDTWHSMGDDIAQTEVRRKLLEPYRVTQDLMNLAAPGAVFTHCMPAFRGEEVTAEVMDGPSSICFESAANRLHAQKAIILWCLLGEKGFGK